MRGTRYSVNSGSDDRDVAPGRRDRDDRVVAEILRQRVVFAETGGCHRHQRLPIDLFGQQVSRRSVTDDRMKDGMVFHVGDLKIAVSKAARGLPVHFPVLGPIDTLRQPFRVVQKHIEGAFHVRLESWGLVVVVQGSRIIALDRRRVMLRIDVEPPPVVGSNDVVQRLRMPARYIGPVLTADPVQPLPHRAVVVGHMLVRPAVVVQRRRWCRRFCS